MKIHRTQLCTLFCALAIGATGSPVFATTGCEQKYRLFALSEQPEPVLWIGEDVGGECSYSRLLLVTLGKSGVTVTAINVDRYGDWAWAQGAVKHLRVDVPVQLTREKSALTIAPSACLVKAPAHSSKLAAAFLDHVAKGGYNGESWNREHGAKGIVLPVLQGFTGELVYDDPGGFYVNYRLGSAYYFPRTGYLLVFTKQDQKAEGDDGMNGFMIFKNVSRTHDPCTGLKDPCLPQKESPCPATGAGK